MDTQLAQLKAENVELKQKVRNYGILTGQRNDLEHRLRVLLEERTRCERDAKDRTQQAARKSGTLENELKSSNEELINKTAALQEAQSALTAAQNRATEKEAEIQRLKADLNASMRQSVSLQHEVRTTLDELEAARQTSLTVQKEANRMRQAHDVLSATEAEVERKERERRLHAAQLSQQLDQLKLRGDAEEQTRGVVASELSVTADGRQLNQREAERLTALNIQLQGETRDLSQREQSLAHELRSTSEKTEDALQLAEVKDREAKIAGAQLASAEEKAAAGKSVQLAVQRENENLRILLDKCKEDVELHRRQRTAQFAEKLDIEREKQQLEREALNKELEARVAQRQLAAVRETHDQLLEHKLQLHDEVAAIQQHAEVLASQNANVRSHDLIALVASRRARPICLH